MGIDGLKNLAPGFAWAGLVFLCLLVWQMRVLACKIQMLPRKSVLRQKSVLTDNETEFFGRLQRALPDYEIWPQVSMGALLQPRVSMSKRDSWRLRREFQSKICDYVIAKKGVPRGTGVVAVVELDDRTHDTKKDASRDAMLASAGIRTIRWESKQKPNESEIRQRILALS
jgi:very-short-patch-repair endonuclease